MRNIFAFSAMLVMLLAGCATSDEQKNVEQAEMAAMTVRIVGGTLTKTVDPGTAAEQKISGLEFYVFDSSGAADTKVNGNGYLSLTSGELRSDNTYRLLVSDGNDKKVVVVANSGMGQATPPYTFDSLIKALSKGEFAVSGAIGNACAVPADGFEMSGLAEGIDIATGQMEDVSISLDRLVSKVNAPIIPATGATVTLDSLDIIKAFGLNSGITETSTITFALQGYALINGLSKSTVAYPFANWTDADWKSTFENLYIAPAFDANGDFTSSYSGAINGDYFLNDTAVYVYENKSIRATGLGNITGALAKSVYAFIIKGTLTSGAKTATRYWRLNFFRTDNWEILRNSLYNVTIDKITTPGYSTPEDATGNQDDIIPDNDSQSLDFIVSVSPWNVLVENQEM